MLALYTDNTRYQKMIHILKYTYINIIHITTTYSFAQTHLRPSTNYCNTIAAPSPIAAITTPNAGPIPLHRSGPPVNLTAAFEVAAAVPVAVALPFSPVAIAEAEAKLALAKSDA